MKTTRYSVSCPSLDKPIKLAVAADLHNADHTAVVVLLKQEHPDLILIPGDLMDDEHLNDPTASGYRFLQLCAEIAPTFYSIGNHEIACYHKGNPWRHPVPVPLSDEIRERIAGTGVTLLDNDSATWNGIRICGLTSGINKKENRPNTEALERFAREKEPRILLCHHPEYFYPYVEKTGIELTVCGHAHGGHWRLFGRGIYAPGQGLLPKYTSGLLEDRCVISRGLANHTWIPRICNEPELVIVQWGGKKQV